jgi:hypothetical protein
MTANFVREIEGTTFEFNTMNAERLQLFQVYVLEGDVKKRFHMQLNKENKFRIMDRAACPESYLHLKGALHDAILENHAAGADTTI